MRIGERCVAGQVGRLAAHVGGTLHVVLAAQRVDARSRTPEVAGEQREVREAHDRLGALVVLGDAETVEGDGGRGSGVEAGRRRGCRRRRRRTFAGDPLREVGTDEGPEVVEPVDPLAEEGLVGEALVEDRGRDGVEERHVRAGPRLQVHVGVLGELDAPRVDDDESRTSERGLLDPGADDRVVLGRVRAADEDRLARSMSSNELVAAPVPSIGFSADRARRVADAGAAVDVVGPEHDARELLDEVVVLVGGPGRAEHADRVRPVAGRRCAGARRRRGPISLVPGDGSATRRARGASAR